MEIVKETKRATGRKRDPEKKNKKLEKSGKKAKVAPVDINPMSASMEESKTIALMTQLCEVPLKQDLFGAQQTGGGAEKDSLMSPPTFDDDVCEVARQPVAEEPLKQVHVLIPPLDCPPVPPTSLSAELGKKYIMESVTNYSNDLKKMMENFGRYVSFLTFIWTPKGLQIKDYDETRSTLIDVQLTADKFERYYCSVPEIRKLFRVATISNGLKSARSGDVLSFAIEDADFEQDMSKSNVEYLHIFIENATQRPPRRLAIQVEMLRPTKQKEIEISLCNYNAAIATKSAVLADICVDSANVNSDQISIQCTPDGMIFSCSKNKISGMSQCLRPNEVVGYRFFKPGSASFERKQMMDLLKMSKFCPRCMLFLFDNFLVFGFPFSLGTIWLLLARDSDEDAQ